MAILRNADGNASKPTLLELELFGDELEPMDVEDEEDEGHLMLKWKAEQAAVDRWLKNEFAVLRALDLRGVDSWVEDVGPQQRANFLQGMLGIPREAPLQQKLQTVMALARFIEKHNDADCPARWKLYYPQRVVNGVSDDEVDEGDADDEEDSAAEHPKKEKTKELTKVARDKPKITKTKMTNVTKTKLMNGTKTRKPNKTTAGSKRKNAAQSPRKKVRDYSKAALISRGYTDIPRPEEEGDWEEALEACKKPRKQRNKLAPYFFSCNGLLYTNVIGPMLNWRDENGRLKITKEQAKGLWNTTRGKYEAFVADEMGDSFVVKKRKRGLLRR